MAEAAAARDKRHCDADAAALTHLDPAVTADDPEGPVCSDFPPHHCPTSCPPVPTDRNCSIRCPGDSAPDSRSDCPPLRSPPRPLPLRLEPAVRITRRDDNRSYILCWRGKVMYDRVVWKSWKFIRLQLARIYWTFDRIVNYLYFFRIFAYSRPAKLGLRSHGFSHSCHIVYFQKSNRLGDVCASVTLDTDFYKYTGTKKKRERKRQRKRKRER